MTRALRPFGDLFHPIALRVVAHPGLACVRPLGLGLGAGVGGVRDRLLNAAVT
jgi:hypothetical protein